MSEPTTAGGRRPWLLALDTATSTVVVAAGTLDGQLIAVETFAAGHRHSEHLLPALERLILAAGLELAALRGVIAGTGPGAFTGLRVGLSTAKTLAHELDLPLTPVSSAEALLEAAGPADPPPRLWLPAGPHERLAVDPGGAPRRERDRSADEPPATDVAVDLDGRAAADALARGRAAVERLPSVLLRLGADRLARGQTADPRTVVPEYVTPPRGMDPGLDLEGGVAWSRGPR